MSGCGLVPLVAACASSTVQGDSSSVQCCVTCQAALLGYHTTSRAGRTPTCVTPPVPCMCCFVVCAAGESVGVACRGAVPAASQQQQPGHGAYRARQQPAAGGCRAPAPAHLPHRALRVLQVCAVCCELSAGVQHRVLEPPSCGSPRFVVGMRSSTSPHAAGRSFCQGSPLSVYS